MQALCGLLEYYPEHAYISGTLHGKRLLDVGSGPVIYPVIQAAKWYDEIYLSDKWKTNVDYLHKWRRGESQHMKYIMEYFAKKDISRYVGVAVNIIIFTFVDLALYSKGFQHLEKLLKLLTANLQLIP